jgi:outer membrane protein assembly factor BamB
VDGKVIVFAGGEGSNGLLAYDAKTGERAWSVAAGIMCYSSPQLATVGGEEQVLMWSDVGLLAVEPRTGSLRWKQQVGSGGGMPRSIQPHAIGAGQLLVASEGDSGTALLDVAKEGNDWRASPRWQTTTFRPSFNDFVVKGDHLYGLDGGSMCCVDLKAGKRVWRKGKYGSGQLLLLEEQGMLLVLCENGDVALLAARPEGHQELARMPAIEGKAWNHPAVARGKLYVRSGEEMACFELPRPGGR